MEKEKSSSLGSPTSSTDKGLTQFGDGKPTAKEMYPHIHESALVRKIDIQVVPVLAVLFIFTVMDRVNIANANVYGMSKDIGLVGNQYNVALAVFFPPFILLQIPGNLLVKRFRPRVWLPACMIIFGCVAIAQGFVKNYSGLLACRFLLGLTESSVDPGCIYLIAMWYKRSEAQKRFSFFIAATTLGGAFAGLLAYAIADLDGKAGLASWQWVFIIEGLMTVGCAIIAFFLVADFPEEARWLSDDEKAFVMARLAEDNGDSQLNAKVTWRAALSIFKDFKIILGSLVYFGIIVSGYGYAYFSPTILLSFGFDPIKTQLFSVPPWVVTFVLSMTVAAASDYYKRRYIFILPLMLISVIGIVVLLTFHGSMNVRYGALFLVAMGEFSATPIVVCWLSTNLSGHLRRNVGTAFQIALGNLGGAIATFSFVASDAPRYIKGYSLCLGFIAFSAIFSTFYFLALTSENRKRAKGLSEHSGKSQEEKVGLGDLDPDYRYML